MGSDRTFSQRLDALDRGLLAAIYPPGHRDDPESLLALHAACRASYGSFDYLEIGSHLGASLQSFVADPSCTTITSIDPRPHSQPDDLLGTAHYPDNSTERMLKHLSGVPGADLRKIHTLEAGTDSLAPGDVHGTPKLCFVDGEHTHGAAYRDALFCREVVDDAGAIVFHDRRIVARAISQFLSTVNGAGRRCTAYPLPSELFVVELGEPRLVRCSVIADRLPPLARRVTLGRLPGPAVRAAIVLEADAWRLAHRVKQRLLAVIKRTR